MSRRGSYSSAGVSDELLPEVNAFLIRFWTSVSIGSFAGALLIPGGPIAMSPSDGSGRAGCESGTGMPPRSDMVNALVAISERPLEAAML